jgi:hypothetical protein
MDIDPNKLAKAIAEAISKQTGTSDSGSNIGGIQPQKDASYEKQLEDDLYKAVENRNKRLEEIKKKEELILENKKNITDYEKVIKGIEEERLQLLSDSYSANILQAAKLIEQKKVLEEQGKLTKEEADKLDAKIKKLKEITDEQAKELKDAKELEKSRTAILSIGEQIKNNLIKQEEVMVNLFKLTGGYNKEISEISKNIAVNNLASGVTFEQGQKALANLSSGFNNLRAYGVAAATAIGTTQSHLEKIGVSGASAAKGFDTLINAMGKTPQQAANIQQSFVQMAAKNKMALNTLSEAFAENSSRFVGYGDQMTKVLDGLAEQSLKTGLKISELINIAQGFDTFEDAARKAGTLNAMLGDQFNAIELLTASDEERIRLLQEGVKASGRQWEEMNRFEKMAIANAAGIRDLNEAGKLFGNILNKNTQLEQDSIAAKKSLADQALETSVAMDKLQSTLNGLIVIAQPFISGFMQITTLLAKAVQGIHEVLSSFLGKDASAALISFTALFLWKFSLIGKAFTALGKKIFGFGKLLTSTTAGAPNPAAAQSFRSTVSSIGSAISSFFKRLADNFPRVVLGILVAGMIAAVIVALVAGLSKMSDLKFSEIIAGLGLLTLVFGMIMGLGAILGSGVGFAAFTLGILGFTALAAALAIMGGALIIVSTGLQGIAEAFEKLNKASKDFATTSSSISKFMTDLALMDTDGLEKITKSITQLAKAISELNVAVSGMTSIEGMEAKFTSIFKMISEPEKISASSAPTETVSFNMSTATNTSGVTNSAVSKNAPSAQTTAFVPLSVSIDGQKIIEVLKPKIEEISRFQSANLISTMGTVISPEIAAALATGYENGR